MEILNKLSEREPTRSLKFIQSEKSNIKYIRKGKEEIFNFVSSTSQNRPGERKTRKAREYFNMESTLYTWFLLGVWASGNVQSEFF